MKFLNKILLTAVVGTLMVPAFAIPSKPGLIRYASGDETVDVRLVGDEHSHYYLSEDGFVLLRDSRDIFHYAIEDAEGSIVSSGIRAQNSDKRSAETKKFLDGINKEEIVKAIQEKSLASRKLKLTERIKTRVADESYLNTFPTLGSPKCVVILVEYQDVKFTFEDPRSLFNDMLNAEGFNFQGATGSVSDYFKASSNGQFTPQFDVYGPVTLPQNRSYYGGNEGGNDLRPYEMVPQACALLDNQIDFRQYDTDGDGVIDNVYLFYAGYGEADGGPESSVWPHSWNVHDDLGLEYYFDGKLLNHYATSNELANGYGTTLAGIGVFCHEFSHVMGLPDLYSTVYTSAFTPGDWSLLDHGSYNNECRTPPLHTAYERYCLGWIDPPILEDPANITMYPVTQIGNYGDAYIIKTDRQQEYYILENRQQRGWEQYIPGHGMLVWHIDFEPDMWILNIVNIEKQYIDIVEADNIQSSYTIEGDTFPGSANVTEFTDDTTPSMRSWSGKRLQSPITEIKEINGVISFMFKGGQDIFDPVVANEAAGITAGKFTASWNKVSKATSYLLSVYTKDSSGKPNYFNDMLRLEVGDVDSYEITGLTPSTKYYYTVQATNGRFYSSNSNEVSLTTHEPTLDYLKVNALTATDILSNGFTANWESLDLADRYTVGLYELKLGKPYEVTTGFDDTTVPSGWQILACSYDSRSAYSITPPSLRMTSDGATLTSSEYRDGVRELSFWLRSNTEPNANYLKVEGMVSGEWIDVEKIADIKDDWNFVSVSHFQGECKAIRLTFVRPESGNIYIDDLTLGYGGDLEYLLMEGKEALEAGNNTSLVISGLAPMSDYAYNVTAHDNQFHSLVSEMIKVKTTSPAGVETIGIDLSKPVEYYNLQGLKVENPVKGNVYIVKQGDISRKVMLK